MNKKKPSLTFLKIFQKLSNKYYKLPFAAKVDESVGNRYREFWQERTFPMRKWKTR